MGNPEHPYLQDQLIAYIGNKRALQPFLAGVFSRLGLTDETLPGGAL